MTDYWKLNLERILAERGLEMKAVSKAAGLGETYVRDILKRDREPGVEKLSAIAQCLQISLAHLISEPGIEEPKRIPIDEVERNDHARQVDAGAYAPETYEPQIPGGIPQIDVEAGAGLGTVGEIVTIASGGIQSGHAVTAEWVVPPLKTLGDHGRIIVLPVIGTSMEPILREGDHVFVDTHSQTIKHGEIYVLDEDDGPIVKRARLLKDNDPVLIEIISENKSIPPLTRPAERVRVIGRVIGRWSKF